MLKSGQLTSCPIFRKMNSSHLKSILANRTQLGLAKALFSSSASYRVKPFYYQELFEHAKPLEIPFKKLTGDYVSTFEVKGQKVLQVEPQALTMLSEQAMVDIAHLLRPAHLKV